MNPWSRISFMLSRLSKIFLLFLLVFFGGELASAQDTKDYPEALKENLAKRRIKEEEKEYNELIKRGEEAAKLSEELTKSYEENKKLSDDDQKKLEKLEKVVKRIRRDLGAENDDQDEKESKPSTMITTLNIIKEKTSNLLAELKKASRYSISVVAVESSNTIFRLIRFLRFNKS